MNKRNKQERLQVVLDIAQKLKRFPKSGFTVFETPYMDLYNSEYPAIVKLKKVFHEYIHQSDENSTGFSGQILFEELNRKIEYILPIKKRAQPLFVLKAL